MQIPHLTKMHHLQHLVINRHLDLEHSSLYIIQSIRAFALSLVGIFLPIYIFVNSTPYPIFHSNLVINGILWALTYFMLRSLGTVVTSYFFTNFILQKVRMDRSIFLSNIIEVIEISLWIMSEYNLYYMILAGLFAGLKVTLFWVPYHIFFVKKFEDQKYGKIMGKRNALQYMFSALAPVVGGIIITNFGYNSLFVASMIILTLSGFLITANVSDWQHNFHDLNSITKEFLFNKKYLKMNIGFLGESIDLSIFTVLWPILLFIVLDSFVKIGFLTSVSVAIAALTTIVAGQLLDKYGSKVIHAVGVSVNSLLYLPRIFVNNPIILYVVDIADKFNSPFYSVPNMALTYEKAKRSSSPSEFIIHRELMVHTCIGLTCGILILVLMQLETWRWVFLLAAVGSALAYFIDLDSN